MNNTRWWRRAAGADARAASHRPACDSSGAHGVHPARGGGRNGRRPVGRARQSEARATGGEAQERRRAGAQWGPIGLGRTGPERTGPERSGADRTGADRTGSSGVATTAYRYSSWARAAGGRRRGEPAVRSGVECDASNREERTRVPSATCAARAAASRARERVRTNATRAESSVHHFISHRIASHRTRIANMQSAALPARPPARGVASRRVWRATRGGRRALAKAARRNGAERESRDSRRGINSVREERERRDSSCCCCCCMRWVRFVWGRILRCGASARLASIGEAIGEERRGEESGECARRGAACLYYRLAILCATSCSLRCRCVALRCVALRFGGRGGGMRAERLRAGGARLSRVTHSLTHIQNLCVCVRKIALPA